MAAATLNQLLVKRVYEGAPCSWQAARGPLAEARAMCTMPIRAPGAAQHIVDLEKTRIADHRGVYVELFYSRHKRLYREDPDGPEGVQAGHGRKRGRLAAQHGTARTTRTARTGVTVSTAVTTNTAVMSGTAVTARTSRSSK